MGEGVRSWRPNAHAFARREAPLPPLDMQSPPSTKGGETQLPYR
jgi:hypothetical protein